jgi:hypothetical protein
MGHRTPVKVMASFLLGPAPSPLPQLLLSPAESKARVPLRDSQGPFSLPWSPQVSCGLLLRQAASSGVYPLHPEFLRINSSKYSIRKDMCLSAF